MAKGPTSVPAPKPFKFIRGTWPPQPKPMYAQQASVKPAPASTRDYAKMAPFAGKKDPGDL